MVFPALERVGLLSMSIAMKIALLIVWFSIRIIQIPDFVGQILPVVDEDKQVTYEFTPGPFTTILSNAYRNPMSKYILIIEEINRGNAPAIFGEVFQLLDRKVEMQDGDDGFPVGTSEYGITHKYMAEFIYGNPAHKVRILPTFL